MRGERDKQFSTESVLAAYSHLRLAFNSYTLVEKEVISIFELENLTSDAFFASLLSMAAAQSPRDRMDETGGAAETLQAIFKLSRAITNVEQLVPKIIRFIAQDGKEMKSSEAEDEKEFLKHKTIVSFRLIEDEIGDTSPARISLLMDAVSEMYLAVCKLQHIQDELVVLAIDSGSDKSFDFLGAAKAMECLKDIILGVYDRLAVDRKSRKFEVAEVVDRILPTLSNLNTASKNGELSKAEADRIRQLLLSGVDKFVRAEAMIPEMEQHRIPEARQIMKTEVKQIEGPKPDTAPKKSRTKRTKRKQT